MIALRSSLPVLFTSLLLASLLPPVTPVSAQEADDGPAVTGRVLDARSGAPVPGAFVGLAPGETGVFADSLGAFRLPVPDRPDYRVVVQALGYSDAEATVSAEDADGADVVLEPDPVALEQLEVLARRFTRERRSYEGAVAHYDEDFMLARSGRSAFEVAMRRAHLRPCGSSTVEEWCTFSRGELVPARVYIDEMPVVWDGVDWLRDYDAGEIYLMEVYSFGRVIRVLTRRGVEERPEQLAALRSLPLVPGPWRMNARSGPARALEAEDPRQLR